MATEKYDFFFLGCWNNDDERLDHRQQVLDLIEANTGENKYDFGLFLGDNIYKTKLIEKKKISRTEGAPAKRTSEGEPAERTSKGEPARRTSKGVPAERTSKGVPAERTSKGAPTERTSEGANTKAVTKTAEIVKSTNSKGGSLKKNLRKRKKTKKIRGGGKGKKNKVFNKATFDFLVYMIKKGNIGGKPIYFINGNHDIEYCIPDKMLKEFKSEMLGLRILNEVIFPKTESINFTNENYILILLDTNKGISRFLHTQLTEIIKPGFNKWIILCGHIPLGSVKMKEADAKEKKNATVTQSLKTLDTVMRALSNTTYKKFLYLCADTHNFQVNEIVDNLIIEKKQILMAEQHYKVKESNINSITNVPELPTSDLRIPEIVAGTGGADPDFVEAITYPFLHPLRNSRRNNEIGLICHMYKPSYGFCDIKIEKNLVSVRYHQLVENKEFISEVSILNENPTINSVIRIGKQKELTRKEIELKERTEMVIEDLC